MRAHGIFIALLLPLTAAYTSIRLPRSRPFSTQAGYVNEKKSIPVEQPIVDVKQTTKVENAACHAVHGLPSKSPVECCKYACELADPVLREELQTLIEPRNYPLFIMEKTARILANALPKFPKSNPTAEKEKLVILGSGWGSATLLSEVDTDRFDVTVISPRNYFLFTPMLAGASVGTVNVRSITQPIREFNRNANYLEATATSINKKDRTVTVQGIVGKGGAEEITVPYDRLVVAVGAQSNTFGIPGVTEHCLFLKQVDDARQVRRRLIDLFEQANYPSTAEEEKKALLTFAVIGAGPTGVEFAAELRDFIEEDGPKYWPHLLKYVSIKVIEATPVILRPFEESMREVAAQILTSPSKANTDIVPQLITEIMINRKVEKITEDCIRLDDGLEIPYGLAIWAGGIGPLPITQNIIEEIGGRQVEAQKVARGKIAVDPWLRAVNGEGRIFALGDCVCTQSSCLPATAQVALQEGEFLAHLLSSADLEVEQIDNLMLPPRKDPTRTDVADALATLGAQKKEYLAPFQYWDLGVLAYTGRSKALAQLQAAPGDKGRINASGSPGFGLWRSIYLYKQSSNRNRLLISMDWIKTRLFGRDITSID